MQLSEDGFMKPESCFKVICKKGIYLYRETFVWVIWISLFSLEAASQNCLYATER